MTMPRQIPVTWDGLPDWVAPPRRKIQGTIMDAVWRVPGAEVTLADLYDAVGVVGQPGKDAVNKALGALVCSGQIVKVRKGVYTRPTSYRGMLRRTA